MILPLQEKNMSLIFDAVIIVAAVAVGVAFYKHGTLKNVVASAKKEASNLESIASKVADEAKGSFNAIVARLKTIK
jgi:hypothetical protein